MTEPKCNRASDFFHQANESINFDTSLPQVPRTWPWWHGLIPGSVQFSHKWPVSPSLSKTPRARWPLSALVSASEFSKRHQNCTFNSASSTPRVLWLKVPNSELLNPFQTPMTHMVRLHTAAPLLSTNVLYQLLLCLLRQSPWEKGLLWLTAWRSSPLWQRSRGSGNMKPLAIHMHYTCSQEAEGNEHWDLTYFLLFTASETPVHCMVLIVCNSTSQVFPLQFKLCWIGTIDTPKVCFHSDSKSITSTIKINNLTYQDLEGCSNQSPQTWICASN